MVVKELQTGAHSAMAPFVLNLLFILSAVLPALTTMVAMEQQTDVPSATSPFVLCLLERVKKRRALKVKRAKGRKNLKKERSNATKEAIVRVGQAVARPMVE